MPRLRSSDECPKIDCWGAVRTFISIFSRGSISLQKKGIRTEAITPAPFDIILGYGSVRTPRALHLLTSQPRPLIGPKPRTTLPHRDPKAAGIPGLIGFPWEW